jgi:hypothetical protein
MGFDFIILVCTAVALLSKHSARTDLWKLLFNDGLGYFIISFSTNCIPAVLNILNLNSIMNVIATIPAATITAIAACRAVMRLLEFSSNEVYVHTTSVISSAKPQPPKKYTLTRPEVHVTTEHITMGELESSQNDPAKRTSSLDFASTANGSDSPYEKSKSSLDFPRAT